MKMKLKLLLSRWKGGCRRKRYLLSHVALQIFIHGKCINFSFDNFRVPTYDVYVDFLVVTQSRTVITVTSSVIDNGKLTNEKSTIGCNRRTSH